MTLAEMVRQGRFISIQDAGEVFLHCLGCLHCREYCKHENNVPEVLMAARASSHRAEVQENKTSEFLGNMHAKKNPWGEDLEEKLHKAVDDRMFVPEAQVVIFSGCQALRKPERHLLPVLSLLDLLGIDYVGVHGGKTQCCGAPFWFAGDRQSFQDNASNLRTSLANTKKIISLCPTCAYVLKGGLGTSVLHDRTQVITLDEFLLPLVKNSPPEKKVAENITFHDPCYLTRYLDRGSQVRELLGMVLEEELSECAWHGKDAVCCGGGGGVPSLLPKVAKAVAEERISQLKRTGAQRVVTACPNCVRQLEQTEKMQVVDLAELILEAYSCKE